MNRYIYSNGKLIPAGAGELVLKVEDDNIHYAGREPRGEMHPDTEVFIGKEDVMRIII